MKQHLPSRYKLVNFSSMTFKVTGLLGGFQVLFFHNWSPYLSYTKYSGTLALVHLSIKMCKKLYN